MSRLKRLTAKRVVKILQGCGFNIHHTKGSHIHLRHSIKLHLRVVVPFHNRVLAPKTIKSIIVQAELDKNFSKYFFD